MLSSSRAWFGVTVFGHSRVFVMNGGLARWRALNFPVETTVAVPAPSEFTPVFKPELLATLETLATRKADTVVVDCRSPAEYSGDLLPVARQFLRSRLGIFLDDTPV